MSTRDKTGANLILQADRVELGLNSLSNTLNHRDIKMEEKFTYVKAKKHRK